VPGAEECDVPENHFIDAMSGLAFLAGGIIALDCRAAGGTRVLAEIPCDT